MKHEPATRHHAPDDLPPTVIHHPEADETLLAQWLRRAMARGASFWILAGGTLAVAATVAYLVGGLASGESETARAWSEVMLASTPEDLQKVAETAGSTPAGGWAGLMAAAARYRDGLARLPAEREAAAPILSQALEGFRAVAEGAKDDDTLRRLATVGIARTYETRDELSEAISSYEKIAKTWPETEDGKESAARAKLLQEPSAVAFYKQFSEYKPKSAASTLGPRGANRLDLPPGHPDLDGLAMPAPSLTGGVPAGSVPSPEGELPGDVFQKNTPPAADLPPVFPEPFQSNPAPKDGASPK